MEKNQIDVLVNKLAETERQRDELFAIFDDARMTLRDQFAIAVLGGMAMNPCNYDKWAKDHAAEGCYSMADAMMEARNKPCSAA